MNAKEAREKTDRNRDVRAQEHRDSIMKAIEAAADRGYYTLHCSSIPFFPPLQAHTVYLELSKEDIDWLRELEYDVIYEHNRHVIRW